MRTLTVLSLLGSGGSWSGKALAQRLGVSTRTVRRDIDVLRELGYAVHAGKGRAGSYRFGSAGMPPLLLDDEQAVAIALALQTAPTIVAGVGDAAARALTTLRAALSPQLRAEVDDIRITAVPNAWESARLRSPPTCSRPSAARSARGTCSASTP